MAKSPEQTTNTSSLTPTSKILRCFTGSLMAGTFSLLAYRLTVSIATTFANKPIASDNAAAQNIAAAVKNAGGGHGGPGGRCIRHGRSGIVVAGDPAHGSAIAR
jgi:hypothetical protein